MLDDAAVAFESVRERFPEDPTFAYYSGRIAEKQARPEVAARLYRQIGRELARRHYACWEKRTVVSRGAKIAVTGRALWQTAIGPRPDPCSVRHDAMLHAALAGLPGAAFPALAPHAA